MPCRYTGCRSGTSRPMVEKQVTRLCAGLSFRPRPFSLFPDSNSTSTWFLATFRSLYRSMEALVAVGLASNVLSFVDFATKLIRTSNELRNEAASAENRDQAAIAAHLKQLVDAIAQTSTTASPEDKILQPVADGCCILAQQLLKRLKACGTQDGHSSLAKRTKLALKCLWNKREIQDMATRLDHFRSEIHINLTRQIQQEQAANQALQPTKDNFELMLRRVDELKTDIQSLKSGIDVKPENKISEVLKSIAELKVENAQFHAQATQAFSSHNDANASFQGVLRPFFDEYQERFLAEVRKELRGTARAEMASMRALLFDALPEIQQRIPDDQRSPETADEHDSTTNEEEQDIQTETELVELHRLRNCKEIASRRQRKNDVSLLYMKHWNKKTKLGHLSIMLRHKAIFDYDRSTRSVYEVVAHFTPSPSWFSNGYSLTFQKKLDSRGVPKFGFQPQTYRVLGRGHEGLEAICRGDVNTVRTMLCQKTLFPSDRSKDGYTLLHVSSMTKLLRQDYCC
ncbi:hypothetical protein BJ170DRAFT_192612 [Xylariales sp. AK1849]|nr:hypothetical protein BJ170DRAFT_192612 [Xylariales sp. AK1849]